MLYDVRERRHSILVNEREGTDMFKQQIDLPGVNHARELGGYAIGNQRIKSGVLIRAGALTNAEPEALARLRDIYHLQTLVDFRMSTEQQNNPDPEVPSARRIQLPVMEMEDFAIPEGIDPRYLELLNDPVGNRMRLFDISYEYGMLGPQVYVDFLLSERGKVAYRGFFQELLALDDGRAILWHCTDGKDRTGCAAMLVLSVLGASRQTVLSDYLLTNEYNESAVESVRQIVAACPMPDDKRDALLFFSGGVAEGYMTHAMDTLAERYGSVDGYLREELGVGEDERQALRDKFLY
ncbi:MAG: tyrosine-protein phosphatase [Atopobiaceae bacterium]|nr:tyrosine-protein phosphatase [Atopobiaceae bacterium]